MDKKVKLGIIGIGNMGSSHAKNMVNGNCPEFELVAVADTNPDRLQWTRDNVKADVACFDDAIAMLDSGLIEACVVAVPHYDHPKYAIACMQRGIHVMVEKPAGVYTLQVREMMDEAAKHPEVVFGLMFNQRTNALFKKLYELVHSGKYGEIRRTNWLITNWYRSQGYYDSGAWRATWSGEGGGVLMNQCPHQLDLWQWICGMPKTVHAHLHYGKWHDIEVEDDVTAYVEYPNGATGVFITTTGDARGTNRFEIQMDKAKFVIEDNNKLTVTEYSMTEQEFSRSARDGFATLEATTTEYKLDLSSGERYPAQNPQHVGVFNAWSAAILRGEPLVARGEEGIHGLTIANAMYLSDWLGKAVELPFDEELYHAELMKRVATSRRKVNVTAVFSDTSSSYGGTK